MSGAADKPVPDQPVSADKATEPHQLGGLSDAVVGIGSNIEPEKNVQAAIAALAQAGQVVACSRIVQTKAIGPSPQADFRNGAVRLRTAKSRDQLRQFLRQVESQLGRVRCADKYAPRTIDLDIVVWNGQVVDDDIYNRDFLKNAVLEVWPELPGISA